MAERAFAFCPLRAQPVSDEPGIGPTRFSRWHDEPTAPLQVVMALLLCFFHLRTTCFVTACIACVTRILRSQLCVSDAFNTPGLCYARDARGHKASSSWFWGHIVGICPAGRLVLGIRRAEGLEADSGIDAPALFGAPLLRLSERGDGGVQVAAEDLL